MAFRLHDPEYKRLEAEEPKLAVTCPSCAGAGEMFQPDQEYLGCPLCSGIGKVVPIIDKRGQKGYRPALFVIGPTLHGPRDPRALEERKANRRSRLPQVDEEGRLRIAISFVPVMPGSLEEHRLAEALDVLRKIGESKGKESVAEPVKAKVSEPPSKKPRKRRARANDDDEHLPCPS